MEHFRQPDGLPSVNGYSHAVSFSGTMVAVSGQVPMDEAGRVVGAGDPEAQIRQVFHNLGVALKASGSDFTRVVKLTVYLTDLDDLAIFRRVRDEYIDQSAPPASSLVQVMGLINPAFRVEVDALAVV
ncbi:RidA family protein [Actinophytocola sp.]|uniref:RidA family protein n=1 Tax=Actinophytocola sp. TaxID=1872138 RepID=UPI002ED42229